MLPDNNTIIKELQTGNEEVFSIVYKSYYPPLQGYLSKYVCGKDAEDIIQATMMWVWNNRHTLVEGMSLKSLIFTIVKNKALNNISHYEIKERVHQNLYDLYKEQFEDPDFYTEQELMEKLEAAIAKLPEDYRTAFEMNRFQNMTYNEIAEKLNVSPKTVAYRIAQSLKILRKELKDYLPLLIWLALK